MIEREDGWPQPQRWHMPQVEVRRPGTLDEAVELINENAAMRGAARSVPLGGGTEILDRLKGGVAHPRELVDLRRVDALRGIAVDDDGLSVGSAVTLAEVAEHPAVSRSWHALAQAAREVATPAVRNMGTLGGNLGQRPRCWYFRNPWFSCYKTGGDACYAWRDADGAPYRDRPTCAAVHPSSVAPALCALGARLILVGPQGERTVAAQNFFLPQEEAVREETVLMPGELIARVVLPHVDEGRSYYAKIRDEESWDFVVVAGAVSLTVAAGNPSECVLFISGLQNRPWRENSLEEAIVDSWEKGEAEMAATCRNAFAKSWGHARRHHPVKYRQAEALVGRLARQVARDRS